MKMPLKAKFHMKLNYWMVLVNPLEDKKIDIKTYLTGKLEMFIKNEYEKQF